MEVCEDWWMKGDHGVRYLSSHPCFHPALRWELCMAPGCPPHLLPSKSSPHGAMGSCEHPVLVQEGARAVVLVKVVEQHQPGVGALLAL